MDEQLSYVYGIIFGVIVAALYMHIITVYYCVYTPRDNYQYMVIHHIERRKVRERERERELFCCVGIYIGSLLIILSILVYI